MSEDKNQEEITEKIKIMATDDEKIKSFGELLTNDSSRTILQLLFNEELTALQIAEKTGISLQLVKYHIIKLQDLGIVKVTKIEKNSKSQDMKFYSASKFSMVIVPPKFSEKTKESKLLIRTFKHIYKIAGFGISAGISGLMSLSLLQEKNVQVDFSEGKEVQPTDIQNLNEGLQAPAEPSSNFAAKSGETALAPAPESIPEAGQGNSIGDSLEMTQRNIDPSQTNPAAGSHLPGFDTGDVAITLIVLSVIFGGLAVFFLIKSIRQSRQKQVVS